MKPKRCQWHKWKTVWGEVRTLGSYLAVHAANGAEYEIKQICLDCDKERWIPHKSVKAKPLKHNQILAAEKRQKKIRKVAKKTAYWLNLYVLSKKADVPMQKCAYTGIVLPKEMLDPHHPYGRKGERILMYVWIQKNRHEYIHDHAKWAREKGWLQPEFDGRKGDGTTPKPWMKTLGCDPWVKEPSQLTDEKSI